MQAAQTPGWVSRPVVGNAAVALLAVMDVCPMALQPEPIAAAVTLSWAAQRVVMVWPVAVSLVRVLPVLVPPVVIATVVD